LNGRRVKEERKKGKLARCLREKGGGEGSPSSSEGTGLPVETPSKGKEGY